MKYRYFAIPLIAALLLFVVHPFTAFAQTDVFTTSGTWVAPAGVTSIEVQVWGDGQGGGGSSTPVNSVGGTGGAGGGYAENDTLTVIPGNVYMVTVGQGGTAGAIATVGTVGIGSSFSATSTISAAGGGSGNSNIGTITHTGGAGGLGSGIISSTGGGGGGGGGGGTANNGTAGQSSVSTCPAQGGTGGSTGGGNGGGHISCGGNAGLINAITNGGGGAGADGIFNGSAAGGNGARGEVDITYTVNVTTSTHGVQINSGILSIQGGKVSI